jgi:hypothetical protein
MSHSRDAMPFGPLSRHNPICARDASHVASRGALPASGLLSQIGPSVKAKHSQRVPRQRASQPSAAVGCLAPPPPHSGALCGCALLLASQQ